jgi:hypothetical protein
MLPIPQAYSIVPRFDDLLANLGFEKATANLNKIH